MKVKGWTLLFHPLICRQLQTLAHAAQKAEARGDPAGRVTCSDGFECGLEVGEGLDAIDLCCGDEQCDAAPGPAAFIMTGERAFFLVRATGRIRFPTAMESISTRPSWRRVCCLSHCWWMAQLTPMAVGIISSMEMVEFHKAIRDPVPTSLLRFP